ncbi:hypothetical protein JHK87_031834 [Glycine soja]|nr:hypothetical protein JHK87_031834 [Glycine soja]
MQKLEEVGSSVKARIKKIMQADEDVGKIALAVPVLVSKALELFLQDLCDRTYEITLQRGAKTMNSLHLTSRSEKILPSGRNDGGKFGPDHPGTMDNLEHVESSFNIPGVSIAMPQSSVDPECSKSICKSDPALPAKTKKLSMDRSDSRNRMLLQKRLFFHSHRVQMGVDRLSLFGCGEERDMPVASKTRNMLEGLVKEGSLKWLLGKKSYFGEEFEEMENSPSAGKNFIRELSPVANLVVRRCSKILRTSSSDLLESFNQEASDSMKHPSRYARNFLEYCCFKTRLGLIFEDHGSNIQEQF